MLNVIYAVKCRGAAKAKALRPDFIVNAAVITIVNYNNNTFTVQGTEKMILRLMLSH